MKVFTKYYGGAEESPGTTLSKEQFDKKLSNLISIFDTLYKKMNGFKTTKRNYKLDENFFKIGLDTQNNKFDELLKKYYKPQSETIQSKLPELTIKSKLQELFNIDTILDSGDTYDEYNEKHEEIILQKLNSLLESLNVLESKKDSDSDIEKKKQDLKQFLKLSSINSNIISNIISEEEKQDTLEKLISILITMYKQKSTFIEKESNDISRELYALITEMDALKQKKLVIEDILKKMYKKKDDEIDDIYNKEIKTELITNIESVSLKTDTEITAILDPEIEKLKLNEDKNKEFNDKYIDDKVEMYLKTISYPKCIFGAFKSSDYTDLLRKLTEKYSTKNRNVNTLNNKLYIEYFTKMIQQEISNKISDLQKFGESAFKNASGVAENASSVVRNRASAFLSSARNLTLGGGRNIKKNNFKKTLKKIKNNKKRFIKKI